MNFSLKKLTEILPLICNISHMAGKEVLRFYKKPLKIFKKSDNSRVTVADYTSEALILSHLASLTPTVPIISEESFQIEMISDIKNGDYWLVDPLDGTDGFIEGNDQFIINIGLIINWLPVLGVVYSPIYDLTYFGLSDFGSFVQTTSTAPERIKTRNKRKEKIVLLYSRAPVPKIMDIYLSGIPNMIKKMDSDAL